MIVVERNQGEKIPYRVSGRKICFDDDLTINLAKRQQDDPVHVDICYDRDGELVIGASAGRKYVAEIDLPAKEYETVESDTDDEAGSGDGNGGMQSESGETAAKPLDMNKVELALWAID